jgi:hypothetical protein
MTMAEIIRQLIDKLEGINPSTDSADIAQQVEPEPSKQPMMMPPLQVKLELLKKAVGVPSVYDNEQGAKECGCMEDCGCGTEEGNSELDVLKRNAGISPAVVHVASDDEPLE